MSPLKEANAKKERLTLSQLASYDDILTDALVDHVRIERSNSTVTAVGCLFFPDCLTYGLLGVLLDHHPKEPFKV